MDFPEHKVNCNKYEKHPDLELRFNIAHGLLEAVSPGGEKLVEWSAKFDSPIADVWRFHNSMVKPVDIFRHGLLQDIKDSELPNDPLLYLGVLHVFPSSYPGSFCMAGITEIASLWYFVIFFGFDHLMCINER